MQAHFPFKYRGINKFVAPEFNIEIRACLFVRFSEIQSVEFLFNTGKCHQPTISDFAQPGKDVSYPVRRMGKNELDGGACGSVAVSQGPETNEGVGGTEGRKRARERGRL